MITRSGNRLQLAGDVTMATVSAIVNGGLIPAEAGATDRNLQIDLSGLGKVDSSAVSLMLAWMREAQRSNLSVQFINVPENLASLARLYGVAEVLCL